MPTGPLCPPQERPLGERRLAEGSRWTPPGGLRTPSSSRQLPYAVNPNNKGRQEYGVCVPAHAQGSTCLPLSDLLTAQ